MDSIKPTPTKKTGIGSRFVLFDSGMLEARDYWRERLADMDAAPLFLPPEHVSGSQESGANRMSFTVDQEVSARLRTLTGDGPFLLYTVLLSAVKICLHKYSGANDIVVGSPARASSGNGDGRQHTNALPIRQRVDGSMAFKDLLAEVRQALLDAYAHQQYPHERIVEDTGRAGALFDVAVRFAPIHGPFPVGLGSVLITFDRQDHELRGEIAYDRGHYQPDTIERFARHLILTLSRGVSDPGRQIAELALLDEGERDTVTIEWNRTESPRPEAASVYQAFLAQAARTPDAMAVCVRELSGEGVSLSYRELGARANALARHLASMGVEQGACVGILLPRSLDAVTAILGTLAAGCAYVPLDPEYPDQRLGFILADAGVAALLTTEALRERVGHIDAPVVCMDTDSARIASMATNGLELSVAGDALVYVIYTSGSTGQPKGCQIEHRNLLHYLHWAAGHYLAENQAQGFGLYSSLAFDLTVTSVFLPLLSGRTLYVYPQHLHVADILRDSFDPRSPITAIKLTPSHLGLLADLGLDRSNIELAVVGGEALPLELVHVLHRLNPDMRVYNEYGPTETTVGCVVHEMHPEDTRVLIGRPIANTRVYVLDPDQQPCAAGVPGELYIGGDGVSRGYLGREDLDQRAFITIPALGEKRLYRTGDLARWTPAGELEFLGRRDHQVKIRGYRIELGEIEARLAEHPEVDQCAVVARRVTPSGPPELVMYVAGHGGLDHESLTAHLARFLPEYMIPPFSVVLERMPLNPHGKLDRRALPEPRLDRGAGAAVPRDQIEARLMRIWSEVLGVESLGVHDNFFALGGQSLKATQVMSRVHRELSVELGWGSIFTHPTMAELADLIREKRPQEFAPIPRVIPADHYPTSLPQRRLWLLHQLVGDPGAYNIADALLLEGELDPALMEDTFNRLIARHEALRTTFVEVEGEPRQVIHDTMPFVLPVDDASDLLPGDRTLVERVSAEALLPFDLERGPLVRGRLLRLGKTRHLLVMTVHHIVCDGWSLEILSREAISIYAALSSGSEPELPLLRIQYKDYVCWNAERLAADKGESHRAFWLDRLSGELPIVDMPADRRRPRTKSYAGEHQRFVLDDGDMRALEAVARERGASTFMACVSVLGALIHRYTGQSDLIFGIPALGRQHLDLEDQVGFYINDLPLRVGVTGAQSFDALLREHAAVIQEAQEHQDFPFEQLIHELGLNRQTNRNPLFDIGVTVDTRVPPPELPGLQVTPFEIPTRTSKFDLTFSFSQGQDQRWSLGLEYSTELFNRDRIERMIEHLRVLIRSLASAPQRPIGEHQVLPEGERAKVVVEFNPAPTPYPRSRSIAALFTAQARRTPAREATRCGDRILSYGELDDRSERLARSLRTEHNVGLGDVVGVLVERSERTPIALLGILKAGAAYLPLDAAWPDQRLQFMLGDSACGLVLADSRHASRDGLGSARVVDLETVRDPGGVMDEVRTDGDALAYIAYTSGSTGEPKGALVAQRSVLRLVLDTNYIELRPDDRILSTGSLAFDASTFEIWGALLNGASVCFAAEETFFDPAAMRAALLGDHITVLFLTTSLFNQFAESDPSMFQGLRVLLTGGEKVSVPHVNAVRAACTSIELLHVYGPTENTTFSTWFRVIGPHEDDVPIGAPLANSTVYILDPYGHPAPIGVPGEICTGGEGVALGYLNRPQLTAERFVSNPFAEGRACSTMYRTGDLGAWRPDGSIVFAGRVDNQVKVRGFRVEPGEIEIRLRQHPAVAEAVVIPRTSSVGTVELVAYYVSREPLGAADVRAFLAGSLPEYMMPAFLVAMDSLPLNTSGKVDRRALPAPEDVIAAQPASAPAHPAATNSTPARTGDQATGAIIEALQELIGNQRIGLNDNIFDRGFDSIKTIQLISRLSRKGWNLEAREVFQYPTVAELASRMQRAAGAPTSSAPMTGEVPLTPVQRWFFANYQGAIHHFNQDVLLRARERIDVELLGEAMGGLFEHHDALRMRYDIQDSASGAAVIQRCAPHDAALQREFAVAIVDLRDAADPGAAVEAHAAKLQESFDIRTGPLMKAVVYRFPDGDRLFWLIHHLIVDGVSWRVLLDDLERAYAQRRAGAAVELGARTSSVRDFCQALERLAASPQLLQELPYWQEITGTPASALAVDAAASEQDAANTWGASRMVHGKLSRADTQRLVDSGSSVQACLLTALGRALRRRGAGERVLLMLEGHGREPVAVEAVATRPTAAKIDLSRTVGWFTSLYPFVLEVSGDDPGVQLQAVEQRLEQVPHKGLGYSVLSTMTPAQRLEGARLSCQPEIGFNYLGELAASGADPFFTPASEETGPSMAPTLSRTALLDVVAVIVGGGLSIAITYSPAHHRAGTADGLLHDLCAELDVIARLPAGQKDGQEAGHEAGQTTGQTTGQTPGVPARVLDGDELRALLTANHVPPGAIEDIYTLSPLQQGLLFHTLYEPESRAYVLQTEYLIEGSFHREHFHQSWDYLIQRHAILRTAFFSHPRPLQMVLRERTLEPHAEDLHGLDAEAQERRVAEYRARDVERGFALDRDPLMRFALFELSPSRYRLVWSYHHIIADGWGMGVLLAEFGPVYTALAAGEAPSLPEAPSYASYIHWLESRDHDTSLAYWRGYLAGYEQPVSPARFPAPSASQSPALADEQEHFFCLSERQSRAVEAVARKHGVTLYTVFQALWGLILSRYNRVDDVVFGTVVSGRPAELPQAERMVGLFINTVPVRIRLAPEQRMGEILRTLLDDALDSEPHRYISLADIQASSSLGRDLFDHLLIFENYPRGFGEGEGDEAFTVKELGWRDRTNYDFCLIITPGQRIAVRVAYRGSRFSTDAIARLSGHITAMVEQAIRAEAGDAEPAVESLDILPEHERRAVLRTFNATEVEVARDRTVLDLFAARVAENPDAPAVIHGDSRLSYRELHDHAQVVAARLVESGLEPGDPVILLLHRSPRAVAGVLGTLMAGGAYVPLDPGDPPARITSILDEQAGALILAEPGSLDRLPAARERALDITELLSTPASEHPVRPAPGRVASDRPAYIIYTSGSTGRPKGCLIDHGNLHHYVHWASSHYFQDNEGGTLGLFTSLSFDLSVTSLFVPLVRGKTIHVFPVKAALEEVLTGLFDGSRGIDTVKLTPAHISVLAELSLPSSPVSVAIVGGEALHREHVNTLRRLNPAMAIYNEYGPTEATVGCVVKKQESHDPAILIGKPIHNTRVYLLDHHLRPVPLEIPGEMYIAGAGVSRGYVDRDQLTRERFVADPFRAGERMYRTGDLGRRLSDGNIEYLGREDDQVKVRGYRIELGEIAFHLAEIEGVNRAVVQLMESPHRGKELCAHVQGKEPLDTTALRSALARVVPEYMVPAYIVQVDDIPLTPHGKIDRKRLPPPSEAELDVSAAYAAPQTHLEAYLARVWQQALGVSRIGIRDDFFELGGHSLKAMQIASAIHRDLGIKVPVRELFANPTIAALAPLVRHGQATAFDAIEPAPPMELYDLSHPQNRLWLIHQMRGDKAYNMPESVLIRGDVDVAAVERTYATLIERHEALRTAFVEVDGEPKQKILPALSFSIRYADLSGDPDAEARARALAQEDALTPFDLAAPPLFRVHLIKLAEDRHLFLFNMHHIIGDGWSTNLLGKEFRAIYDAYRHGLPNPLAPLRIQYKDFSVWQNARGFDREERYWLQQLAGARGISNLPFDRQPDQSERDFRGKVEHIVLEPELVADLRGYAQARKTTLSNLMLSLCNLFLHQLTHQDEICMGMGIANRDHAELERLVGFFVNILPIRIRFAADMEFDELLDQVTRTTHQAFEHQSYPFDLLIRKLRPERFANWQPFLNVVYAFQNFNDVHVDVLEANASDSSGRLAERLILEDSENLAPYRLSFETSKFDLIFFAFESKDQLHLSIEYDTSLFLDETIRNYLATLQRFAIMVARGKREQ